MKRLGVKTKSRKSRNSVWPRRTIAVLILIIVVLGSVAVYYSPIMNSFQPKSLTPVQIYASASQGVVTIQGVTSDMTLDSYPNGTLTPILGTGFVVVYGGQDYIVTNYHVIEIFWI